MGDNKHTYSDWKIEKLGTACEIIMGQSPSSDTYNTEEIGLPFFQGKAEFTQLHPIVEKWCSKPNKIAEPNDILLSVRAPVGATNIANQKCCIGRGLAAVRYPNYKYLFYFLRSIAIELDKKGTGTTFKAISGDTLRNTQFPNPTEQQQQAIVSKLEELFSKLDNGVESLKTLQHQLKVYRQAVLKWAFEGRLTNANVKDGELPEGWINAELGDYIENIEAGKSFKCDERPPNNSEIGVLKVSAVTWGEFDEQESKTVVDHSKVNPNYFVKIGDFLFSRANTIELVGACVIVKQINKQLMLSDKTLRFEFKSTINKTYALYYLRSFTGKKQIQNQSTGNQESMRNIGQGKIKQIEIVMPDSLELQNKIVQEIESRLSVCDKIEETIAKGLKEAEALRQSILKQAFEGVLI
jgi:type I restriction enzyme S subunit